MNSNSDHPTRASGVCLDISALPAQLATSDMADFEAGTWTFSMHGDWKVTAGDFAIVPADSLIALLASHQRLKEALRPFADIDTTVPADMWAVRRELCERARAALEQAP